MGKILLIEPHRILQQAIALALFPEHEVKVEEAVTGQSAASWKDYELLIVDGAALRESGQLSAEVLRAVQSTTTPMVWLEEDERHQPPRQANLVMVRTPIDKEVFCSAVAESLSPPGSRKKGSKSAGTAQEGRVAEGRGKKAPSEASPQESFQFIELLDIVEGETGGGPKKKAPKKPK